jgi:bifunctional UDP-N-acetylglucosamine pyrophosphorylase/glucosamine-1-phosphate N-acetyltransferase
MSARKKLIRKASEPRNRPRFAIAIMAAGKGTRLKSQMPKVLHEVGGKPLLLHVLEAATQIVPPADVYAIVGHEAERVRAAVAHTGIRFVEQLPEQRGTGHAIMVSKDALRGYDHVLVLSGDAPLITSRTLKHLRDFHLQKRASMTILTAILDQPRGYGRIIRRSRDDVSQIAEEKSLSAAQRLLHEVNAGFYAFAVPALFEHIQRLSTDNAHREYYLTDIAAILAKATRTVVALPAKSPREILGCNTRWELAEVDSELRLRKARQLSDAGVTIYLPQTSVIDADVEVGPDTVIEPFVQLLGNTRVGANCRIRSYTVIKDSELRDRVLVRPGCILDQARVAAGAALGPYSHLRPGSDVGEDAHVGNFVEIKKARLGRGAKANHLTYLGDAEVGAGVNVGAGTITCNYDGEHKHTTVIEDGAFIGSDVTLVAPVRVGRNAYIGAGSTITDDVPEDALALARSRQATKADWVARRRERKT